MSAESSRNVAQESEARWVPYSWAVEIFGAAVLALVVGPAAAWGVRIAFPRVAWLPAAAIVLMLCAAAFTILQRARGHDGRWKCPQCNTTLMPTATRMAFPAEFVCRKCAARVEVPARKPWLVGRR